MSKYLNSTVGSIYLNYEGTYHDYRTTSLAVEFKGHHVGLFFHLTFAGGVIEVQDTVVDASLRQETLGHGNGGRALLTNCRLTWKPSDRRWLLPALQHWVYASLPLEHREASDFPQLPPRSPCFEERTVTSSGYSLDCSVFHLPSPCWACQRTTGGRNISQTTHQKCLPICTWRQRWLDTGTGFPCWGCSHHRTHENCTAAPDIGPERQKLQANRKKSVLFLFFSRGCTIFTLAQLTLFTAKLKPIEFLLKSTG